MKTSIHPFEGLSPDLLLDAVESVGYRPDGSLLALNSYENRVYQVRLEEGGFLVAKFYRPDRWSDAAILEEHTFAWELAEQEIPVVAPLAGPGGQTLFRHQGYRFALFPRQGGRSPELDAPETLLRIGRFLGRLHAVGSVRPFAHRPSLDVESFGREPVRFLLTQGIIPEPYREHYRELTQLLLVEVEEAYRRAGTVRTIRLHGDCHVGNILWTEDGPHFVDLDDCRQGPAIQDLWMMLSGERAEMTQQLSELLEGYEEFHSFDLRELHLLEALRTLRLIHYAGWLARRWDDPAFPAAFPWFNTVAYWEEHLVSLREQLARIGAPPLVVAPI